MQPSFILLHVTDPAASATFYGRLFGCEPVEASPTFAMFAFENGLRLGLWARAGVEPPSGGAPGSSEIGIPVGQSDTVDSTCRDWEAAGMTILQPPTDMDFGRTFVGLDPDGFRLRVFCPN